MPYVKTINEDGVVSDIMAKALDPDVLVNGFTQTTAGVNALDAAAGKTLNDSLSTLDGAVVKKADLVNGFTQTTAGVNALDAAAGKTLHDQIDAINGLLPFYFLFTSVGGSASKVFTVPNNTSIWVLWAGGNNSANGIASMRIVDNNTTNFHSINAGAGSSTTLSAAWNTSTGKLTLSNSGTSALRCFIFSEKQMTAE